MYFFKIQGARCLVQTVHATGSNIICVIEKLQQIFVIFDKNSPIFYAKKIQPVRTQYAAGIPVDYMQIHKA